VLLGLLIYLLVLMFFDSIDMLLENFFSREAMFIIVLSLIFFEINRVVIVLSNRILPIEKNLRIRITIQYAVATIASILVVSAILYYYFITIEGFSTIRTELITFNALFLFSAIFYHLFYFSLVFVNRKNEVKVKQEQEKNEILTMELETFKYQVNPDFLFKSLEIIINELHRDKKAADDLVNKLSTTYRYTLDNRLNDLVSMRQELESLAPVRDIFKANYNHSLEIVNNVTKHMLGYNLIPGTLKLIFEFAMAETIISPSLPLKFMLGSNSSDLLEIQYRCNRRLVQDQNLQNRLAKLFKAYGYYSGETKIDNYTSIRGGYRIFTIPLLKIEEE
jgi:hypothetical protein